MKKLFQEIFEVHGKICTQNLILGKKVYGEKLVQEKGIEYRQWDLFRSKLAGAVKKGLQQCPLQKGSVVLYLGISEGTTASHISDIVGENGIIFGVDISQQTMKKLLTICESRTNIVPILADANQPEKYQEYLKGFTVDLVYMDVSQKNQVEILIKNVKKYLPKDKLAFLCLKAKSISSTEDVNKVFETAEKQLNQKFQVLQSLNLNPFDKDHKFYVLKQKD